MRDIWLVYIKENKVKLYAVEANSRQEAKSKALDFNERDIASHSSKTDLRISANRTDYGHYYKITDSKVEP